MPSLSSGETDPSEHPAQEEESLRRKAIRGTTWTTAGFGAAQVLRLVSNILLAAMLQEDAFALMALVNAIIQGLAMFSDIGLAASIIQNPNGDDRKFLDTAWTLEVVRGAALALIAVAASSPVADFYARNDATAAEVRYLLPLVAIGIFIDGFQSTKIRTAARHMQLGRTVLVDLCAQVTAIVIMVVLTYITRSVYALAFGGVAGSICRVILAQTLIPGPSNRFRWDPSSAKALVRFGKWIFLSTVIAFLALQLDKLIFARLFPFDEMGVYAIAASLAMLTPLLVGRVQASVAFPLYSRMLDLKSSLEAIVGRTKEPMLVLGGYMVALSIAGAESFIAFAYDPRYSAAGTYIPILAGGAWFAMIDGVYGAAFLASGRAQWVAGVNATKVAVFVSTVGPMARAWGLTGAVVAIAFSDLVKLAVSLVGARGLGLKTYGPEVFFTSLVALVGLGTMTFARLGPSILQEIPWVGMLVEFTLVTAAFAPFGLRTLRSLKPGASPGAAPAATQVSPAPET